MGKLKDELGFFTAMPEKVIELTSEIGSDAVFLYLYLRYKTNKERGCAWPSYEKMRSDIRWGKQRISNAMKALVSMGLLMKRKRYGQSTEYVLPKPPDMGGTDEDTPSSTATVLAKENDSSTVARPKKYRSATPVVPERDKVLKTQSTQTESKQTDIKDSRSNERTRKKSFKDKIRGEIADHFSETTGLSLPKLKTVKQKKEAGALWFAPIREICDLVEWRKDDAQALIDAAISRMDGDNLTISSPKSILKVCQSIVGEVKRGSYKPEYSFENEMEKFRRSQDA